MKRIAIFASGSGTNAENIVKYFNRSKEVKVEIVLSDNSAAKVLERMKALNVQAIAFTVNELNEGKVLKWLLERNVDFIVLAGFLKLIPENLLNTFENRIVNIHPALLPKFGGKGMYGIKVHKAVIDAGERESGISIHLVNKEYDKGKIIFQAKCPVLLCDMPETLAERIHALEYEHYPVVIERLLQNL